MPLEFIGIAATQDTSETGSGPRPGAEPARATGEQQSAPVPPPTRAGTQIQTQTETGHSTGPAIQPAYLHELARAHEESGFDRVLIAHSSSSPDAFTVADQILTHTERLGVLLAHRPGFVSPTVAARKYATLDAFHPGRVALHVITGGDDTDQARDGDFTDKPTRYRRTDDFLDVVRKTWTATQPFDHEGEFYRVKGGLSTVRPEVPIPVYFGGASEDAVRVGGRHADVYAFWGEPLAGIAERIRQVRAAAAPHGRSPRFSVSLRPIPAATEAEAWERAREILRLTRERFGEARKAFNLDHSEQRGSQRLLEYAAQGEVHDKRLWTEIARTTGAAGNSTALVGSYEQVAESLLDYVGLGVSTLLIRGFTPLADARDYRHLVELVRAGAESGDPVALEDPVVSA
ncbi:Methanesulfonate monooxygenase [Streptomyces sp. YIM 130001]|uniref:LLM class flavin-dependent oxidoreductase n=1 Tax=Streptomyces sp. YIM 130001 TaxID=2259644 RepID=UPI000ED8E997|nr:LLM class flavin-dependent oxidoreductase [Streptomyces sp. YIM 130001]RII14679.1 Methanesulfonate monooxygenase [Streptomyces sp. YIM 130001]